MLLVTRRPESHKLDFRYLCLLICGLVTQGWGVSVYLIFKIGVQAIDLRHHDVYKCTLC
jgi:hypothetical protein